MSDGGGDEEQAIAVVASLLDVLDRGDFDAARRLTSEDFETVPVMTGEPMDRERWLASHAELERAFPDLRRHPEGFQVRTEGEEQVVEVTLHVTATHDHTVELPSLGIGPLPPTGLRLEMPAHCDTFRVRGGEVVSVSSAIPEGGGLKGMLARINEATDAKQEEER